MQRSLNYKLTLAFLVLGLLGVGLATAIIATSTTREFHTYVDAQQREDLVARWTHYYVLYGSWASTSENLPYIMPYPGTSLSASGRPGTEPRPAPDYPLLVDASGLAVFRAGGFEAGQSVPAAILRSGAPIVVNGQTVGTLILLDRAWPEAVPRASFLTRFRRALYWGAAGAALLALAVGVVFSRSLTRPLRELTLAAEAMSRGELLHSIPVRSDDEVGNLTHAFNQMSANLARAQELRRKMTADVAHELRTPLSLVLGHAEALRDGVIPPSPETYGIIHDEAQRLARLVADLRTLSLSDAGELTLDRAPVPPAELLSQSAAAYGATARERRVSLTVACAPDLPDVLADADRVGQVLGNLLSNALRHTPAGGAIVLRADRDASAVRFSVHDTGPGIAPEDLPYIFERFYRADRSRQRDGESTGLGLAIARSLVEAHGGAMTVDSEPGQGANFAFNLPATPPPTQTPDRAHKV
ncbi:MAG: HAMP domain-containing histidine kinase [Chloroflexi bacterium]|nr:HAMP domain-containing histidine kinase [Chloroflexota bacterium]